MRNLKKVIALVAVFAMLVSSVAFAQTFTDVAEDHDYYEAIEMLSSLQILTGDDQDGDGKLDFRPEDTITRAEVAAIISRIQNITSAAQTDTEFVDVPASHWASGYVAQAAGQGIVNGYGDGNFGPEDPVLYEQAVKMLVETLGYAPFVKDNGGYPTGHLTAASRYGILEGVVGGSIGAQATRGMVAQMVYNAIDTPIMDRFTYGADAEYVIYNGKNGYDYLTLLNRDLGVKKFTGIINQNQVTSLTAAQSIDTDEEVVIDIDIDYNDELNTYDADANTDFNNYDCKEIDTIYEADSNAGDLLGYHVEMYVQEAGRNGYYNVLSVAATNKNKVVEFNLDQFESATTSTVDYYKNESDRKTTEEKLATDTDGYDVIYNNIATDIAVDTLLTGKQTWSGKVTLVDNDANKGADVVFVEIGTVAVVEEVSANGKISFKNDVKNSIGGKIRNLYFDEDETSKLIKLTKDGDEIEFTELQEWDVLSVLFDVNDPSYIVADVVSGGKIEGTITGSTDSETSAYKDNSTDVAGKKFTINGTAYDVAEGYDNGTLKVGASGVFYVDNYGKIVAYDKNGSKTASDKYGYVLQAAAGEVGSWGEETIKVLLLDKSGDVYEAQLADKVKFENAKSAPWNSDTAVKMDSEAAKDALDDLETALLGQLITYDSNSAGEIDEIAFPAGDEDDDTFYIAGYGDASYDEEDRELKITTAETGYNGGSYDLDDDTIVFYINNAAGAGASLGVVADKIASKIGTAATVATTNRVLTAVYDAEDGTPAVVVFFDTTGGISPATNAAIIDEIGSADVDGEEVISVTYFMNGEKLSATTDPDFVGDETALENAKQGSIWKFSVVDGVILEGKEYVKFDGTPATYGKDTGWATGFGLTKGTWLTATDEDGELVYKGDESVKLGAALTYNKTSKKIGVVPASAFEGTYTAETVADAVEEIRVGDANVYVFDPVLKKNKIQVGVASDVNVDDELIDLPAVYTLGAADDAAAKVAEGSVAAGLLDYVAAVYNENDALDVVIYKAYEFKYEIR